MQKQQETLYLIKSILADGQLIVSLDVLDSENGSKIVKSFGINYSDDNLPEDIKKNFKDISNVHCILNESPDTCRVNMQKGVITIVYHVVFPNGHKFQLEGHLVLEQKEAPVQQEILPDESNKRLCKIEQDVKKLQQFCEKESIQRQQESKIIFNQLKESIRMLRAENEEMKYWRSQQEAKQNKSSVQCQQHSHHSPKKNIQFSDEFLHVFDQKFDQQKQFFAEKLQKQAENMEDLRQTCIRHQKIIDRLSQQNVELKKTLKGLEEKSASIFEKNDVIQVKLLEQIDKNENIVKAINSQQQELQQIKTEVKSPKKQSRKQPFDPLQAFFQNITDSQNKQSSNQNQSFNSSQHIQSPKATQQKFFLGQVMEIHPQSGYFKQFINTGKLITYNGITEEATQLVGKLKIEQQRVSFITVAKSRRNYIGFGIMDEKYLGERNSIKNPNYIIFYGSNGGVYENAALVKLNEVVVKVGDKIKMRVNPVEGFVEWSIGGVLVCKHKSQRLKQGTISWIPFISLCDKGDTVRWTLD